MCCVFLFFLMTPRPPRSTLFPSTTLFRSTIMTAVPRLFEKVFHKIVKKGTADGGWKAKLFNWALGVGQRYAELRSEEHTSELQSRQYFVCRLLLEKKKHTMSTSYRPTRTT